ncbi:MAG: hypothetical protein MK086_13000 [Flavobacteriales bacterium]|nr:hypothetical protein [Flavobacteriales bacterium]
MEMIYTSLLITHVTSGGLALAAGSTSAIFKKGSKGHSVAGKFFGIFMSITGITAIALSMVKTNSFLFGIGLFTIYLISSGWIWIKKTPFQKKTRIVKVIGLAGLASAAFMITAGFLIERAGIILFIFAGVLIILASVDVFKKVKPIDAPRMHGGRMGGAFIAAVTAFLVTNVHSLPMLLIWIGPTVIGSPLIAIGIRKYYQGIGLKKKRT